MPSTPESTTAPSDDVDEDVDVTGDEGYEEETSGGGGVPTGAVVGIAVGVALFVAILCAVAFIWYRKRHVGPKGALDSDKASQEMLGQYHFPGHLMVQYPNAMYAQPTQMMPLYQFPPGNPSLLAQPYDPSPGVSHELAGEYVQAHADIS